MSQQRFDSSSLIVLGAFFAAVGVVRSQERSGPCTVCMDGTNNITRPDYQLVIPGFPQVTCQTATFLASAVSNTSTECQQARLLGSPLCGCPLSEINPCLLCDEDGGGTVAPSMMIRSISDVQAMQQQLDNGAGVPTLASSLFGNQVAEPTCEMTQAVLLNYAADSDVCQASRAEAFVTCGCDRRSNNTTIDEESSPTPTSAEIIQATTNRCSLCPNGEPIALPDREITGFFAPTCSVLSTVTSTLPNDSPDCSNAQQLGVYCGCPAPPPYCSLCTDGRPIPQPNALVDTMTLPGNFTPTCAVFEGLVASFPPSPTLCSAAQGAAMVYCGCPPLLEEDTCIMCPGGIPPELYPEFPADIPIQCGFLETAQIGVPRRSDSCFFLENIAHACGCRDFVRTYGGAETIVGQIVLAWAPRLPSLLSLAGSFTIISAARKTHHTMYHQIMISISVADIISSISWFMSSWPIPPEGINADFWGANGNKVVCKMQGLFLIWSTSSHWLNLSLSVYYKLVIVNGWRERQFTTSIRVLLLGLPLLIGTTIAALSFQYIVASGIGCSFLPFPRDTKRIPFYFLIVIPLCTALVAVTAVTLWISWKFSQQMQAADRWRLAGRRREALVSQKRNAFRSTLSCWAVGISQQSLEGSVLRQSIFYLLAFCSSAPIVLISTILLSNYITNFWVTLLAVILTPLQGFTNALIFFRPRIFEWCSSSYKTVQRKTAQQNAAKSRKEGGSGYEDPTESNHTDALASNRDSSDARRIVSSSTENGVTGAPEVSNNNNEPIADLADQMEHQDFLRSHLHGAAAAVEGEDDDVSLDLAALEPQHHDDEPTGTHEGSIVVGSLVLPSFRGSSRWDVNNWEPEVSDFVCDEDDVILSDEEA